ncbi:unnamed protein product [Alopecurus aequalis]
MASTISTLLSHLLLLVILVQFTHSATTPKPKIDTEHTPHPSSSHTYIVHTNHLFKPSQFTSLEQWYASMVTTHSLATNSSARILYTYDTVLHGFAVRLTNDEAQRMSRLPGVSGVYKSRVYYTQTTRSPGFLGLSPEMGAWPDSEFGDGIVIGIIDTGIWPERPSFDDSGLGPVRPTWRGKCVDAEEFNASLCNNKLVGAKVFVKEPHGIFTPRDKVGHGTHVAATAAGSKVLGANLFNFSRGVAWGVAPKAKIAIDFRRPFYNDIFAIATFGAESRGVLVVLAGGNEGPRASTVTHLAPWMITVGAATMDRVFPAKLKLGNGLVLTGQSLYTMKAEGMNMIRLVHSSCKPKDLTPDRVMGKVVVCSMTGAWSGMYVQRAGGAGLVSTEKFEWFRDAVMAERFPLPGLALGYTAGKELGDYMSSVPYPVASLVFTCETVTGANRAPMVAGFSSRCPSAVVPEILKPDVVAPGVNILAAWSGEVPLSGSEIGPRRAEFNIISGTSMACPHVAGAAALIKRRHGDWTPAMVRSALMTSARTVDNTGKLILDNGVNIGGGGVTDATPFVVGAGFVDPERAMNPGLVYEAGTQDYIDFLCSLNYTVEQMRRFVPGLNKCTTTLAGGVANLNYPSLVVVFDNNTRVRTLKRTVTKVSMESETYFATVAAPDGVHVTVTPSTLEFRKQNEKRSYTVEFRSEAEVDMKPAGWGFGFISWANVKHKVRSPITFKWEI